MAERKRILIVDDDEMFVKSTRALLESCGHEVYTAGGGEAGLNLALELQPDLMTLDVMMGTQSEGFEVARRARKSTELKGMKILVVTGVLRAMDIKGRLYPSEGWFPVDRVLEKPVSPEELIREVKALLEA